MEQIKKYASLKNNKKRLRIWWIATFGQKSVSQKYFYKRMTPVPQHTLPTQSSRAQTEL